MLSCRPSATSNMDEMFEVHSAHSLGPDSSLAFPYLHATCAAAAPRRSPRIIYPLLTRQEATAFNQRLYFETSSVAIMGEMFPVTPLVPCI